jgi:hypothetical protein
MALLVSRRKSRYRRLAWSNSRRSNRVATAPHCGAGTPEESRQQSWAGMKRELQKAEAIQAAQEMIAHGGGHVPGGARSTTCKHACLGARRATLQAGEFAATEF